eukprot:scaffold143341_cov41-Prasinocladus_malaysianus.AAC.2
MRVEWLKKVSARGNLDIRHIETSESSAYAVGWLYGEADFGNNVTLQSEGSSLRSEAFIAELDAYTGDVLWAEKGPAEEFFDAIVEPPKVTYGILCQKLCCYINVVRASVFLIVIGDGGGGVVMNEITAVGIRSSNKIFASAIIGDLEFPRLTILGSFYWTSAAALEDVIIGPWGEVPQLAGFSGVVLLQAVLDPSSSNLPSLRNFTKHAPDNVDAIMSYPAKASCLCSCHKIVAI